MPHGYEVIRDRLIRSGLSKKKAQERAARIWNSQHPGNPVGGHDKKKKK